MKSTITTALEAKFFAALKTIASYQSVESLSRHSRSDYGVDSNEAIEMAYENIIQIAKLAVRGIRKARLGKDEAPGGKNG